MNENISVFGLVHTQMIPLHCKSPPTLYSCQNGILTLKLTLTGGLAGGGAAFSNLSLDFGNIHVKAISCDTISALNCNISLR